MATTVKTAISLPRDTFARLETIRKRTRQSRSRILLVAFRYVAGYLRRPEVAADAEGLYRVSLSEVAQGQRALQVRVFVLVAQITSTIRDLPVEVPLGPHDGLPKRCVVNCDVLTTVPKQLLCERLCLLRPETLAAVNMALAFALGLT